MALSVFEVFKIVLGIIIGTFFLYFMLQFSNIYSTTEIKSAEIQEYKNLKKLVEDTYIYGIQSEIGLRKLPSFASPPFISEGAGVSVNPSIMFFFKPGERLVVYKNFFDYRFCETVFTAALPEPAIL